MRAWGRVNFTLCWVEKGPAPVQRRVAACVVVDEHGAVCLEDEQSETTANGNDMFSQLS